MTREVRAGLDTFRFNDAALTLYQFIWHEYCDWSVEISKIALSGTDAAARDRTRLVLAHVLEHALRLLHPLMPFITEEIWQQLPGRKENESIMMAEFPNPDPRYDREAAAGRMGLIIEVITAIRNIRGEMNLPPGEQIVALLRSRNEEMRRTLEQHRSFLQILARVR